MKKTIFPQEQTFWYLKREDIEPLRTDREADVIVVGGGMAGLTAAQCFANKGKKVILLEAFYCGAGASGKSSGFITPNGEISISGFMERYGKAGGQTIWRSIESGVELIRRNIIDNKLDCDYNEEDSMIVANREKDLKILIEEAENLELLGHKKNFVSKEELPSILGSTKYYGGVIYANNFGINAYKYCQGMKSILQKQGVEIYEDTPVLALQDHLVTTKHAKVKAKHIIVCADRFIPNLGKLTDTIYHIQTVLMASQVLTTEQMKQIFPQRRLMVWDTDSVYQYFRLTGDRLLLGGGSLWSLYDKRPNYHNHLIYKKYTDYVADKFGMEIQFEHIWPGLIGVSKDIAPIAGPDKDDKSIYYIGAAAGLPIAAMLANYCAENLVDGRDDLHDYFSPYRKFPIGGLVQKMLGNKVSFALSNKLSS